MSCWQKWQNISVHSVFPCPSLCNLVSADLLFWIWNTFLPLLDSKIAIPIKSVAVFLVSQPPVTWKWEDYSRVVCDSAWVSLPATSLTKALAFLDLAVWMLTSFTYKALDINYLIVSSMKLTAIFSGMSSLPQFLTISLLSFQPVSEMLYSQ